MQEVAILSPPDCDSTAPAATHKVAFVFRNCQGQGHIAATFKRNQGILHPQLLKFGNKTWPHSHPSCFSVVPLCSRR